MKKNSIQHLGKRVAFLFLICLQLSVFGQENTEPKPKSDFWKKVQFGGELGLGFGSGYSNITIAPSAIYNFNNYLSAGLGVQYSHLKQKEFYTSNMFGGSIIGLAQPVDEIQLSLELEQLRVNLDFDKTNISDNFWNTGLFVGAGYRMNNVTVGARYNLLFQSDKGVYGDALIPFVRMFF
jgi:long-subunit fatty acid transport protein